MSHRVSPRSLVSGLVGVVALLGVINCGGDSSSPSKVDIQDFIAGVTNAGNTITATRHSGTPPASTGAQTVNVTGGTTLINGGSAQVTVGASSGNFTDVFIAVDGVDGYYQLTLPGNVTTQDLLLTAASRFAQQNFTLSYGIGNGGGLTGQTTVPVTTVNVGAGDVQVSVSWDAESDVDLHVVQPDSEEVWYGNDSTAVGGKLDLDSNPACSIDHVKNENITFSAPPTGTYKVRVDYYDACGVEGTNYVVTVRRKGHPTETFTGQLTGSGDHGSAGSGVDITSFVYP